jgi:hypothetical protein
MHIAFVGKFEKLYDEEYIARSFEALGHTVSRLPMAYPARQLLFVLERIKPDIVLCCKWERMPPELQANGIKTVCWLFDLYFGYEREYRVKNAPYFKADRVFTTDGGHQEQFKEAGVKHQCVRQGIYEPECYLAPSTGKSHPIVFVGSYNPLNEDRNKTLEFVEKRYGNKFAWYGKENTHELRGHELNELYAKTKIVIGDSVYSPYYWSNRVVETLGRGGFLIHQEVEGLKEAYPHLVTYRRGDLEDLHAKIEYYLTHEQERKEIVQKNFEWVKQYNTMDKRCAELISKL